MKNYQRLAYTLVTLLLAACGGGGVQSLGGVAPIASPAYHATPISGATPAVAGTGIGKTLSPADLYKHYGIGAAAGNAGAGQTIAIVDAPGSASVLADLTNFSSYYGLPKLAGCASGATAVGSACPASGVPFFTVLDQSGGQTNSSWAIEISLDVEWAHAIAPAANIILVVARSASMADMMAAVSTAAAQPGVVAVSMSWGAGEFSGETGPAFDAVFSAYGANGVVFLASSGDSGDNGSNQIYPAASPYVTAVGGTSISNLGLLTPSLFAVDSSWETGWAYGGGGASLYEKMPAYQSAYAASTFVGMLNANGGKRAIPDVAYNADPRASPVGVLSNGVWYAVGGTSAGAPQWAAIVAQMANYYSPASWTGMLKNYAYGFNGYLYNNAYVPGTLFDITKGTDKTGVKCTTLCNAAGGYDDVTGLGVPVVSALLASYH